jgi:hypothetical protein
MVRISRFTTVRSQNECIEISLLSPSVEARHICEKIVNVITIGWILLRVPLFWTGKLSIQTTLDFTFVVNGIEAHDSLKKDMKFRVGLRVLSYFEKRLEDIYVSNCA